MYYRITLVFCIAFIAAINSLTMAGGQPTDSLLYLLNNGLVKDDAEKYELLCRIASYSTDADSILKYSDQAIKLAGELNILPAQPTVFKGSGYLNSGELALALECFMKAANYYKEDHNNTGLAAAYLYIAEAYNQQENFGNAKYYLKNAIEIYRKEKDSVNLASSLHNLGYADYSMGQYDSALVLFSKTSEIYRKLGRVTEYAYCLGNSGMVYFRQLEYEKAEDYLLRAIDMLTKQGDDYAVSQYMIEYAGILQHKGEIKKAIACATKGFNYATKNSILEFERDAAYRLSHLYQLSGKYDSAYHYQSLYVNANDSIKSFKNIQKMADLRTEFEVAKKQAEVNVLQKKKVIQLIVIVGLALILLLAMGLIMLYYYSLKRAKKLTSALDERRILLEKQSTELKEHQEELSRQKEELQSTLENLQKTQEQLIESEKMAAIGGLVAGVAHEINTPVGIGITAISNLLDDIQKMAKSYERDEISRKDFKGFLESSNDTAKLIHRNLERTASLVQSFKQVSADQASEQQRMFELKEYFNDILLSLRPKFREKKIEIKVECDEKLTLNSYPGVYAQIFTNLLLNSLQHGFPESDTGIITIKADVNRELLKIHYSDDGAGISKKDLPHIFEPFYTSDKHRGTGLGLNIVYNLVRQKLHGTITCESEPGEGVLFAIEVPLKL
jgi:signal transduction histidine kinase